MSFRTGSRIAFWLALILGVPAWMFGYYDAYTIADKACLRARVGAPAERAKQHLRDVAAGRGVEVRESGERTSAVFQWLRSYVAGCSFVTRDGRVIEVLLGTRALAASRQ